ncbi:MAG: endonuclease domain-containing protein [Ginsengibacter sp.]
MKKLFKMKQKSPYKEGGMFEGADPLVFGFAKQLRKEMTDAEKILWMHLRPGIKNLKFRRQHPIGIYVADFFCHKLKLVIEVDGSIHNLKEIKINDKEREQYFIKSGYQIIRFSNKQVQNQIESILAEINSIAQDYLQKRII